MCVYVFKIFIWAQHALCMIRPEHRNLISANIKTKKIIYFILLIYFIFRDAPIHRANRHMVDWVAFANTSGRYLSAVFNPLSIVIVPAWWQGYSNNAPGSGCIVSLALYNHEKTHIAVGTRHLFWHLSEEYSYSQSLSHTHIWSHTARQRSTTVAIWRGARRGCCVQWT